MPTCTFLGLGLTTWSDGGALITALVAISAFGIAVWQAREASKVRKMQAVVMLNTLLGNSEAREARAWFHEQVDHGKTWDDLDDPDKRRVEEIVVSFDQFAALVKVGALSGKDLAEVAGPVVEANFERLSRYFAGVRAFSHGTRGKRPVEKGEPFVELHKQIFGDVTKAN